MSKGSTQSGDGDAYRRNYPFGDRRAPVPAGPVDARDAEIARLRSALEETKERLAGLQLVCTAQSRVIASKARLWSEEEREVFRLTRANRLASQARADAEAENE